MSSTFALGLERPEDLTPSLQAELEQVMAAIQTQGNAIGRVNMQDTSQIVLAANNSMTWTNGTDAAGSAVFFSVVGGLLFVNICLPVTTVGGTPSTQLRLLIPDNFRVKQGAGRIYLNPIFANDGGVGVTAYAFAEGRPGFASSLPAFISFSKFDSSNWTAGNVSLFGQLILELES